MTEEISRILKENEASFRQQWSRLFRQKSNVEETDRLDYEIRKRHNSLWEALIHIFQTNDTDDFLKLIEEEGRHHARLNSRIETLDSQLTGIMNLIWEVMTSSPHFETNPKLLRPLTSRLNTIRTLAKCAIIKGYTEETQRLEDQENLRRLQARRSNVDRQSLLGMIRNNRAFRLARYHEGQEIFQSESRQPVLYFVIEGRVRLYEILPDGRSINFSILSAGDVFVHTNSRQRYLHDIIAETMENCVIASIKESELAVWMEESPLLATQIMQSFSQQLSQSQFLIESLIGRDVAVRVANLLLKLAREFGVQRFDGAVNIQRGFTHQELADMIGSNRVTVTRKLTELQNRKLIEVNRSSISIINQDALEELVS